MREEIRRVCKEHGLTTLYVTHDQKEALAIADRIAVMHAGEVKQIGTPWEVYRAPRSRRVATFLGETNLLDAEIVGSAGDTLRIKTGELELLAQPRPDMAVGRHVLVSIRPECVRLSTEPAADAFRMTIQSSSYLGELSEHVVSGHGLTLRAYELNPRAPAEHAAGTELWAQLRPADVVLLEPDRA
jgi:iron(III) transport system ATP-binding protein